MNKRDVTFAILAVVLLGGGALYYHSRSSANKLAPATAAVTRGDVIAKVDATGVRQPVTTVQVGTQAGLTRLSQLVGVTARMVALAVVPLNDTSLLAAAQDFVAAQVNGHRIVTVPALPGDQPRVHTHRLTRWR